MSRAAGTAGRIALYRAVGERELEYLLRLGDYGLSPSQSGKYFPLSEAGIRRFAGSSFNARRRLTITRITVATSFLGRGHLFFDPGGAEASIHFDDDVLVDLYEASGLPEIVDAPWIVVVQPGGDA